MASARRPWRPNPTPSLGWGGAACTHFPNDGVYVIVPGETDFGGRLAQLPLGVGSLLVFDSHSEAQTYLTKVNL